MTDQEHIKELVSRMTHQSGHLIKLLTEIAKLKEDVAWWQGVCRTKDETIKSFTAQEEQLSRCIVANAILLGVKPIQSAIDYIEWRSSCYD